MTAEIPDPWQHVLPPSITTDAPEQLTIPVHVPHGSTVIVVVADEDGHEEFLTQIEDNTPPRQVDGVLTGRARFALGELAPAAYTLRASVDDGTEAVGELLVTNEHEQQHQEPEEQHEEPETSEPGEEPAVEIGRPEYQGRNWGFSAALYAIRSTQSWGVGDFGDLADLAVTAAIAGADYVLLTPLAHNASDAIARLGLSAESRGGLVIDPSYVRPEDIRETAYLPSSQRTMLEWGAETIRSTNSEPGPIDFDAAWDAKRAALEVIHSSSRSSMREAAFVRFKVDHGRALAEYVHAAVAAETDNPESTFADLCADTTAGAAARREHQDRIDFYLWLQWVGREQLARAQTAACEAGMRIGLVHTAPAAADLQILGEIRPYGGGVYLDNSESEGLEAVASTAREAGVLLFADGRDLSVREHVENAGIVPHTTLRAEFDGEEPRDLGTLPQTAMISLATTEEPPTAGFLADEHLALMERLGLLEEPERVRKTERIRRERLLGKLQEVSLIDGSSTERQLIESLHRYITRSPAQFITVTLSDGVGDRRPFVLGGGYPDWRYPYTDGAGASVLVDELAENARFNSLLEALDTELRGE